MGTEKTAQRRAVHQPIDKPKLELMLSVLTCEKQTPADIEKWPLSFGTVIDNSFIDPQ